MMILRALTLTVFAFLLNGCAGYKVPSLSGDPSSMSAQTLCFNYASSDEDPQLAAEIAARNLDCAGLLRDDPLVPGGPELDAAHRMGR